MDVSSRSLCPSPDPSSFSPLTRTQTKWGELERLCWTWHDMEARSWGQQSPELESLIPGTLVLYSSLISLPGFLCTRAINFFMFKQQLFGLLYHLQTNITNITLLDQSNWYPTPILGVLNADFQITWLSRAMLVVLSTFSKLIRALRAVLSPVLSNSHFKPPSRSSDCSFFLLPFPSQQLTSAHFRGKIQGTINKNFPPQLPTSKITHIHPTVSPFPPVTMK